MSGIFCRSKTLVENIKSDLCRNFYTAEKSGVYKRGRLRSGQMENNKRLKFLQTTICLGFIFGILFSYELWFPVSRTFPHAPILFESPIFFDWIFTLILFISLIFLIFSVRPTFFLISAIFSLALLIFFDQMRLQPWVYQYLLLLIVLAFRKDEESNQTLGLMQIIIAGLYVWSGLQKLNFSFANEVLPAFLPNGLPFGLLAISIAVIETFIGIGLIFRKTRNLTVIFAAAMHLIIFTFLIANNYNQIVWIWNVVLILLVCVAFWKNYVSIRQILMNFDSKKRRMILAKIIAIAVILLPILNFFGFWDSYLSGALYSGRTEVGVMQISENLFEKLPPKAKENVFRTKNADEQILPFFEWSMNDLNVPVYPETRIFKQIAREICKSADEKKQSELIIKKRPAIFDGNFEITRINCKELF